jgi:hypothetical protein
MTDASPDSTLALISCVSQKRALPSPACDLYVSQWFRKARAFVEARGYPWLILSAEHGLLDPAMVVAPYERTLNKMGVREREAWAEQVIAALEPRLGRVERVVALAGDRYRAFLIPRIQQLGVQVEVPMLGLSIGRQLKWLNEHTRPQR